VTTNSSVDSVVDIESQRNRRRSTIERRVARLYILTNHKLIYLNIDVQEINKTIEIESVILLYYYRTSRIIDTEYRPIYRVETLWRRIHGSKHVIV